VICPTGPIEPTVKDTAVPRLYFCSYSIHSFGTITPASSIAIVEVIMTLETSVFAQRTLCKVNGPDDSSCRLTRSASRWGACQECDAAFRSNAPCSKVLCGWLMHCKCFLVILCGLFSQYSRVSGLFM
jgi:hypothetical protein